MSCATQRHSRWLTPEEMRRRAAALVLQLNREYPPPDGWTDWRQSARFPTWAETRNGDRGIGAFLWRGRFLRFIPFTEDHCFTGLVQTTPEGLW